MIQRLLSPIIPWKRVLRSFLSEHIAMFEDYCYSYPNFRHPMSDKVIIPGFVKREVPPPVICIDVSESVIPFVERFISEVVSVMKELEISHVRLILVDDHIRKDITVSDPSILISNFKFSGGCGTNFTEVFKKVKHCPVMIFLTDGFAEFGKKVPSYPVLWILTKQHNIPPFGKVAYIMST